jgi:hypothetical protein
MGGGYIMTEQELIKLRIDVAEKVMGLKVVATDWPCYIDPESGKLEAGMWQDLSRAEFYLPVTPLTDDPICWPPKENPIGGKRALVKPIPEYESDIVAVWQIIDKLILTGWFAQLNVGQGNFCILKTYDSAGCVSRSAAGEASDMPMAICLAAYKAVTGKDWK